MTIRSHAKVNIFLKITGLRGNYHELSSRFMQVKGLFDTLSFIPKEKANDDFTLQGSFGCQREKNTIYKAWRILKEDTKNQRLDDFFKHHAVVVEKKIPEFAGLGGGSSNAAAFMKLCNKTCKLNLDKQTLAQLGSKIGADVPFFIYDYPSANVSGIGEIVEPFEEDLLDIKIFTPPIKGDTAQVYTAFRKNHIQEIAQNASLASCMEKERSNAIMKKYTIQEANDLFAPALYLYPQLQNHVKEGWFFSGSGSTFFTTQKV